MIGFNIDPARLEPASIPDRNTEDTREETASRYLALALLISRSGEPFEKPVRLKVTSSSMLPLLQPGDSIFLEFATPASLQRGDIVTFWVGQNLMTHRLILTTSASCLTKGDASLRDDPPIDRSKLLGRVVAYEHRGGTVWMTGLFWRGFNHLAGLLGFWESRATRLGDRLFHRKPGAQLPAWVSLSLRLVVGLFRLPVKVILKLYYAFFRLEGVGQK